MILQTGPGFNPTAYERINGLWMRKDRTLDGQPSPIIQRAPRKSVRAAQATRRNRRNSFFKRIAFAWKTLSAPDRASFAALATTLSPWENWFGNFLTLSSYQAYQILFAQYYGLYLQAILDPVGINTAFAPWPAAWPAPISWGIPTIDYNFSPPKIFWPLPPEPPFRGTRLLTVYLADPRNKISRDPFKSSYRTWTNNAPLLAQTPTLSTWQLPNWTARYPYNLPDKPTDCALRPGDGTFIDPVTLRAFPRPFSQTVQRFTLDRPLWP